MEEDTSRKNQSTFAFAVSVLAAMLPGQLCAQDIDLERAGAPPAPVGQVVPGPLGGPGALLPDSYGLNTGFTFIGASHFAVRNSEAAPVLAYSSNHFHESPGSASPTRYFAQADLEQGVLLDMVTCIYRDASATNDIYFALQKYSTNMSTGTTVSSVVVSAYSTGSAGSGFEPVSLSPPETIDNMPDGVTMTQYYLAADIASDTSFAGCYLFWGRQVTPAPATATFDDVPTGHWAFRYIEALSASGITGGCGAGAYCPDNPVTRAQMAVFIAKALGLYYQSPTERQARRAGTRLRPDRGRGPSV